MKHYKFHTAERMLTVLLLIALSFIPAMASPAEKLLEEARGKAVAADYAASSKLYGMALAQGADSLVCLQGMADNAMASADYAELLRLAPMIRELDDWMPYTYNYEAQANAALGNIDAAVDNVVTLVDMAGIDNDSYEAMTAVAEKDLAKMAKAFRAQAANDVHDPVWDRSLGTIFTYARLYDRACEAYLEALKRDPGSDADMEMLALLYNQMRQYEQAVYYATKALELNPGEPEYVTNKAVILRNAGRTSDAIALLTKSMRDSEGEASFYISRGMLEAAQGKYQAAVTDYDSALKMEPESPVAWLRKGIALFRMGRKQQARNCFLRVVKLNYSHWSGTALAQAYLGNRKAVDKYIRYGTAQKQRVDNYFSLAAISDVLGRTDQALDFLKLALAENALNPDIVQYDQSLQQVTKTPEFKQLMLAYSR